MAYTLLSCVSIGPPGFGPLQEVSWKPLRLEWLPAHIPKEWKPFQGCVDMIDLLPDPYKNFVSNKLSINLLSILVNKKYFFMDGDRLYRSAYSESNNFSQWDAPTSNGD